eukprot:scaffold85364_cov48-Phaeocystis_antarctica.AAC.3
MGRVKTSVLPEPVKAIPIMSRPESTAGRPGQGLEHRGQALDLDRRRLVDVPRLIGVRVRVMVRVRVRVRAKARARARARATVGVRVRLGLG